MKKVALFILVVVVFNVFAASAQTWQWGSEATAISHINSHGFKGYDIVSGVASDNAGNSYLTGNFDDTLIFGSTYLYPNGYLYPTNTSMFLAKYNVNGTVLWVNQSINNLTAESKANGVATDAGGNIYIAGTFSDTVHFGSHTLISATPNCYLVKYAPNGNVVWAKQSVSPSQNMLSQGIVNSVATDKSGNVYITGNFKDTISFGSYTLIRNSAFRNIDGIFLAKYDSSGNILWAEQPDFYDTYVFSSYVAADRWGNVFLTGEFGDSLVWGGTKLFGSHGWEKVFVIKLDSGGKPIWARQSLPHFSNSLYLSNFSGQSIATDNTGNAYITGTITDTSSFGAVTLPSNSIDNIFLVKYDANGNVAWAKISSNPSPFFEDGWQGFSVVTDTFNNYVYLQGAGVLTGDDDHTETIIFETDTVNFNHSLYGNSVIIKLDTSGKVICGNGIPEEGSRNNSIALDPTTKDVYLGGELATAAEFGPDLLNGGSFIAKWQPCLGCAIAINISPRDTLLCSGKSVALTASGGKNYSWFPDYGLNASSGSNVTATPTATSTYTIYANDSLGCSGSARCVVTVASNPFAGFTFSINGNRVFFNPDSSSSDVNSYYWDFGDSSTSNKTNPFHTFNGSGIFNVCLSVYNNSNCSYTVCKNIDLISTGISSVSENDVVHLYPNPANNTLNLSVTGLHGNYQLKIYNVLGQPVGGIHESPLNGSETIPIDLSGIAPGTYELILMDDKEYFSSRFVHLK